MLPINATAAPFNASTSRPANASDRASSKEWSVIAASLTASAVAVAELRGDMESDHNLAQLLEARHPYCSDRRNREERHLTIVSGREYPQASACGSRVR